MEKDKDMLLKVSDLSKHYKYYGSIFDIKKNIIKAVDDISFCVLANEIFAVVGETGCGKSTLAKLIMGLIDKTSGDIYYKGELLDYKNKKTDFRKNIQIVFQDPYSSLNPKKKIYKIITYPAVRNRIIKKKDRFDYAKILLKNVGLDKNIVYDYPYELSGGQRQRVGIARSLSVRPELLVLDEPVSALDMSISAQVLNLLIDLQKNESMSYIFITHDLKLVRHIAGRVMVMYGGKIMEIATVADFFDKPAHPYSTVLYNSMLFYGLKNKFTLKDFSLNRKIGKGCVYYEKCYASQPLCMENEPPLINIGQDRKASCFFPFTPLNP